MLFPWIEIDPVQSSQSSQSNHFMESRVEKSPARQTGQHGQAREHHGTSGCEMS